LPDISENEPVVALVPFWYLRHGETDWNRQGLSQGNMDIPLNELGLAQAQEAAVRLRNRGITSIVASPLSRARVTAEIVGEALGLNVTIEPDLREVSWGVHEGKALDEWFHTWITGHATPEGAESFDTLRRRAVAGLNRAVGQPPAVLVVAHGGVFRAIRSAMKVDMSGRTRNCVPIWCEPPRVFGEDWTLEIHE
jgi:broad specificity phosphatase PhoE